MNFPKEIQNLSLLFSSLPNVGPKLSNKIALYLSINAKDLAKRLSNGIDEMISNTSLCEVCGNVTNKQLCDICSDQMRDQTKIIIVEDPLDLVSIEDSGQFLGLYHVLNGLISPLNGIGPDEIRITELINRIKPKTVNEVIFALNPILEGEATSLYIRDEILKVNAEIKITRLAKGIPMGADIEYLSGQTLGDSLKSRTDFAKN